MSRILPALLVSLLTLIGTLYASPAFAGPPDVAAVAVSPSGGRWWTASKEGLVVPANGAPFLGDLSAVRLNRAVVGMASTPTGNGYWLVASDGGVFSFGDARFHGSTGAMSLNSPVVALAATVTGNGYWLVAADGGVFAFGDARFLGSTGAIRLNRPVVGMASTPTGNGYWLVATDGGIFAFGDAKFAGSTGSMRLNSPVVGMAAAASGEGYWLVAADGGIFAFGAPFYGSGVAAGAPGAYGMAPDGSGGYYVLRKDGSVVHCPAPTPSQTGGAAASPNPTPPASPGTTPVTLPAPAPGGSTGTASNPLEGVTFYGINTAARNQAIAWAQSRPADSALMTRLANTPTARWLASSNENPRTTAASSVNAASVRGAKAVLVLYQIPFRDCGSYSSGGQPSEAAYRAWIDEVATGIGNAAPVVIVEPDALAQLCGDVDSRYRSLRYAVETLAARTNAVVYLDAGSANWVAPATMATRLNNAGVASARGFAVNVSNFKTTTASQTYGDSLAILTNKHYVVDTSRNGLGPGDGWCNPVGRALGAAPGTTPTSSWADAYVWVKTPGASDGPCNGGPAAGVWWDEYALGMAVRAWT